MKKKKLALVAVATSDAVTIIDTGNRQIIGDKDNPGRLDIEGKDCDSVALSPIQIYEDERGCYFAYGDGRNLFVYFITSESNSEQEDTRSYKIKKDHFKEPKKDHFKEPTDHSKVLE